MGRVCSGVFCPVCGSEMVYSRHGVGCSRILLACFRVERHDKVVDGVSYRGMSVFRLVFDDELRVKFGNVFELWFEGGKVLPFKVRRLSWADGSHFVVRKIVVSEKDWDYFALKGKLYGEAYGCFVCKESSACDIKLGKMSNAGCYEWVRV